MDIGSCLIIRYKFNQETIIPLSKFLIQKWWLVHFMAKMKHLLADVFYLFVVAYPSGTWQAVKTKKWFMHLKCQNWPPPPLTLVVCSTVTFKWHHWYVVDIVGKLYHCFVVGKIMKLIYLFNYFRYYFLYKKDNYLTI